MTLVNINEEERWESYDFRWVHTVESIIAKRVETEGI